MILIDTSVWIDYFRGADPRLVSHVQGLLEEDQVALAVPVRIELLGGCSLKVLPRLRRVLDALPVLFPTDTTWELMERWVEKATAKGERFGVADLLIAAIAAQRGLPLWSLDRDFVRMEKIGFVRVYAPS
jgi:hypothetical protein